MDGRATIFNWFDLRLRIIQKANSNFLYNSRKVQLWNIDYFANILTQNK